MNNALSAKAPLVPTSVCPKAALANDPLPGTQSGSWQGLSSVQGCRFVLGPMMLIRKVGVAELPTFRMRTLM